MTDLYNLCRSPCEDTDCRVRQLSSSMIYALWRPVMLRRDGFNRQLIPYKRVLLRERYDFEPTQTKCVFKFHIPKGLEFYFNECKILNKKLKITRYKYV